ncbi:MAG: hypothetical protein KF819_19555 [Labilithrix sp.]|nr:hypothetical protein [Labilithrix sp.]
MRIRVLLLVASAGVVAAGGAVQACGGTEGENTPGDAGVEAAPEAAPKDSGIDTGIDAGPPCDTTKDFTKDIPDASIADGASTTGICVGCANTKCRSDIEACNKDCKCQEIAGEALECYATSQDILGCAGSFVTVPKATRDIGISLFQCIAAECPTECAADIFLDGGVDGGI